MEVLDEYWMLLALDEAREAARMGEVPVGAVIVRDNRLVSVGRNRRESDRRAIAHAEIEAIDSACRALGGWRLHECSLYVTLEPCPMCAGAIINARLRRVVYGARDPKAGCCGSLIDLFSAPFNHHPEILGGILEAESAELLRSFFRERRLSRSVQKEEA